MKEQNFIYDVTNIRDLAPSILRDDKQYKIVLTVIDALISKHIVANIEYLEFLERIDTMEEKEIDLVAKELSVDFYDFSMSIEEKRKACKLSFQIHSIKGTNKAIQDVLNIFYEKANILEFPEFNGDNGTFKIEIMGTTKNNLDIMIDRVEKTKKKSQHLTGITFKNNSVSPLYVATYTRYGTRVILYPQQSYFYLNNLNLVGKNGKYTLEKRGVKNG